jgi:hypothetical protein
MQSGLISKFWYFALQKKVVAVKARVGDLTEMEEYRWNGKGN